MPRQTAAEKLAARAAAETASAEGGQPVPEPPPDAPKPAPLLAPYDLFGLTQMDDPAELVWVPLGTEVKAPTYTHAMELAKEAMRQRIIDRSTEDAPAPATLRITVAAIASRNWNQGTAIIESRPVTTWEKS